MTEQFIRSGSGNTLELAIADLEEFGRCIVTSVLSVSTHVCHVYVHGGGCARMIHDPITDVWRWEMQ